MALTPTIHSLLLFIKILYIAASPITPSLFMEQEKNNELDQLHQSRSSRRRETSEQIQVAGYSHSARVEPFMDYSKKLLSGEDPEIAIRYATSKMGQDPEMKELAENTHALIQLARKKKGNELNDVHGADGLLFTLSSKDNREKQPIREEELKEILTKQLAKAYAMEYPEEKRPEIAASIEKQCAVEINHIHSAERIPAGIEVAQKELKETIDTLQNEYHKLSDEKEAYLRQGKLSYTEEQWKEVKEERQEFSKNLKDKYIEVDSLMKEWKEKPISHVGFPERVEMNEKFMASLEVVKDRVASELADTKITKDENGQDVATPINKEMVLSDLNNLVKTKSLEDIATYLDANTNITPEKLETFAMAAGTQIKESVKADMIEDQAKKNVESKPLEISASERVAVIRELLIDGRDGESRMHKALDKACEQSEKLGDVKLTNIIKEFEKEYTKAMYKDWDAGKTGAKVLHEAYISNMDDKKKAEFIEANSKSVSLEAKELREGKRMHGTEPAVAEIIAKRGDIGKVRLEAEVTRIVNREMAVDNKIMQQAELVANKKLGQHTDRLKNLVEEVATKKGIDVSQHDLEKRALPVNTEKAKTAEIKM